jgi:hypothetical protein
MTDDIKALEEKLKKASGEPTFDENKKPVKIRKFVSKSEFVELASEVKKIFCEQKNANPRLNLQ